MYYEPYEKKRGKSARFEAPKKRSGCAVRLVSFAFKFIFKLIILVLVLAVLVFALPPGLFNIEPEKDLSIASGLPGSHVNVLLLGVDVMSNNAQRSDSMLILSIGYNSVKLSSILRDTVVDIPGHGTQKINAAFAQGGAELAMRTVNQAFGMNITKYVVVDFVTVAKLVEAVGGVDLVISQSEMNEINKNNHYMLSSAERSKATLGFAAMPLNKYSNDNETPVHLTGLEALGFARIRKLDSDFMRTSRQRRVVEATLATVKGNIANPLMYYRVLRVIMENVDTNLGVVEFSSLATKALVCGEMEQLRLPVDGSYKDNGSKITIDEAANAQALQAFIYGG